MTSTQRDRYTERFLVALTPEQRAVLDELSEALGVSRSEILRAYLNRPKGWLEPLVMKARGRAEDRH